MKKTILTLVAILLASLSFAQGGGFNYKALITDNGNVLNTQPVTFKFTVLENGTTSVYQETQSATTDANGIVAVNVGEGTLVSGNFNTIDWGSNPYFLKVEIDTGSGYQDFGTTEFKAVPYAKFAEKAGNTFSGDFSALSNVPAGLSDGDNDTHLTESQVDSYVSNNGYLTQVDNIRGIPVSSTAPTNGQILKYNGSQFVPADDDTSGGSGTDGVVNSAAFSGTSTKTLTLGRSNGLGNVTANFTDNDTHLTDAQIGAMGYIKNANDADHDATNEIQNLTLNSTQLSISNGNNVNFTGWDTNAADDFDGNFSSLSNVPAGLSDGDDDTHLTDAQIGAMGYIKNANDADHDASNELQNLTLNSTQLSISNGNNVNFTGWDTNAADDFDGDFTSLSNVPAGLSDGDDDTHLTDAQIGAMGYIKNANDADHDATNEIQTLSVNSNQLSITNGNTVTLPAGVTKLDDLSDAKSDSNGSSVFIGIDAGANDDQSANRNVGVGFQAMNSNTTGFYNTASGYNALYSNTTGSANVAGGYETLYSNTTGYNNTAVGFNALYSNTTGSANTANGEMALFSNTEGIYNTANGSEALYSNTIGSSNTADGYGALRSNTEGGSNTATGYYALRYNTTGGNNTASGRYALYSNTMGVYNTASGSSSLRSNTTGSYNIAIGGNSLNKNTTGRNNIAIGYKTMYKNTTGEYNTANGNESLYSNTTGIKNTSNGNKSMNKNTTGSFNTANGHYALYKNTTGSANTANGCYALDSNTTGDSNVAIGTKALYNNTDKSNLVAIGDSALFNNGVGVTVSWLAVANTAVGSKALFSNTSGNANSANGFNALYSNTTGGYNTANGQLSLYYNTTGSGNTANGTRAMNFNATGNNNTALGYKAFYNGTNYSNSTALGYNAQPNGSNQVRIGNNSVTSIGGYANWTNVSDGRFKTNIQENVVGLDFITKLRPVTYHLDMDAIAKFNKTQDNFRLPDSEGLKAAEVQTGFIAQEVEQAAQSVGYNFHGVDTPDNENDHYGLRYAEFVVPLTKAVQELNQKHDEEIEALKTTIQNQQNEIEALKKQNEEKQKQQEKELQELKKIVQQLIKDK